MTRRSPPTAPWPGLCGDCRWARRIVTKRGSSFLLCARSRADPSFPKYPPLPVPVCRGYAANEDGAEDGGEAEVEERL